VSYVTDLPKITAMMKVSTTILLAVCALAYADYPAAQPSSHYGVPSRPIPYPAPVAPVPHYGPPPSPPMKGYGPPTMHYGPPPSKGKGGKGGKGGFSFKLPKFEMPKFKMPKLPKFEFPKLPKFDLSKFKSIFDKGSKGGSKGKGGGYPAAVYPQPTYMKATKAPKGKGGYPAAVYPQPSYPKAPKGKGKGIDFKGMMKAADDGIKGFGDKIAQKFHDVKSKILGWKGDLLLKKGQKISEWGQKLIDEASYTKAKGKGSAPGPYPAPHYPAPHYPAPAPAPYYPAPIPNVPIPDYNVPVPDVGYGAPKPSDIIDVPVIVYDPVPAPIFAPVPAPSYAPVPAPSYAPVPAPAPHHPVIIPGPTYGAPVFTPSVPVPVPAPTYGAPQQGLHQHHHHHSSSSYLQGRRPIPVPFLVPVNPMKLLFPRPPAALVLGAPRPNHGSSYRPGGSGAYVPDSNTDGWLSTPTYSICPPYTMDQTTSQTHTSTQTPHIDIRIKPQDNARATIGRTFGYVYHSPPTNVPQISKPLICSPIKTIQNISYPQHPNVYPIVAVKPPIGMGALPLADSLTNIHGNISDASSLYEFLNLTEHEVGHRDSRQYEPVFIIKDDDSKEQLEGKHESLILIDSLDNLPSLNYVNNNISSIETNSSESDIFNFNPLYNLAPLDEIIPSPDMIEDGWKISENFPTTNINDQQLNESEQEHLSVIILNDLTEKYEENLSEKELDDIFLPPLIEKYNHTN